MNIDNVVGKSNTFPLNVVQCELPQKGLISAKEMLPLLPIKRSTLWKWVKMGTFPAPVKVNTLTRWHCHEVHEWLAQFDKPTISEQGNSYVS